MKYSMPLGISPTAMQKMAHPEGENANARGMFVRCNREFLALIELSFVLAAGTNQIPFILSTIATSSIEEVSQSAPNTLKWFQLYIYKDR